MKRLLLIFTFLNIVAVQAFCTINVSIEPISKENKEGRAVPLKFTIENESQEYIEIPQYSVPFYDFDLIVKNSEGKRVSRAFSIFNLTYLKTVEKQKLGPGEIFSQRINDIRDLYAIRKVDKYTVYAEYYVDRNRENYVTSNTVAFDVGNVAGDHNFLIFSDSAYIQSGFTFADAYPNSSYLYRDFSNSYYILGLSSERFQAGVGYSDGTYGGAKWQLISEEDIRPAVSTQFFQWNAARKSYTRDYQYIDYWLQQRGTNLVASKRLPQRSHIHVGLKRYEIQTRIVSGEPVENVHTFKMIALDTMLDFGFIVYELDYDDIDCVTSEGFFYRGLPSWDPQIGAGLVKYRESTGREVTMVVLAIHFYIDNFLLGYKF